MTTLLIAASLFFTNPAPLEMPRAKAYLAHEDDRTWLEDRFDPLDLWTSRSVDGRWIDDDGRTFVLATLATRPPALANATPETRTSYTNGCVKIGRRKPEHVREAAEMLAPVELAEKPTPPRQTPRGYADVDYWQGTNRSAIVCTFRVKESNVWRLATWTLAEDDDFDESRKRFEDEFLDKEFLPFLKDFEKRNTAPANCPLFTVHCSLFTVHCSLFTVHCSLCAERSLLRADARHSVAAYPQWHVTDAETYSILDDLTGSRGFVTTLTNELARLRVAATNAIPTSLDASNVLCVARIYANRSEYLDALEADGKTNMSWSAAYWSPARRELVAYLPEGGDDELFKTIRHEAFHQHLSYATAMITTSPWLNEGYAQYFEDPDSLDWALGYATPTPETLKDFANSLPALLTLDYDAFYDGTDIERRTKYRLAWSIAVFLEKGAPDVRFAPFKNVKRDYVETLLQTQDALKATNAAFKNEDTLKLFVAEWLKWWKEHLGES